MKIVIKTTGVKLTRSLEDLVEEKINSLEKFAKSVFDKVLAKAWVEIGKTTRHHKKGPYFFAEVQLRFPGKSIRAVSEAESLERAIVDVKDELQIEIKKYKEKLFAKTKRKELRYLFKKT